MRVDSMNEPGSTSSANRSWTRAFRIGRWWTSRCHRHSRSHPHVFSFSLAGPAGEGDFIMGTTPIPPPDATDELHRSSPTFHPRFVPIPSRRWRSRYHAIWYHLSEQMRWSRRPYRETPVGHLPVLPVASHADRGLCGRGMAQPLKPGTVAIPRWRTTPTSITDQAWHATDRVIPAGGRATGCRLRQLLVCTHAPSVFRPSILTG